MSELTTPEQTGRDVFANTILSLAPYANEIVLIGGWVHELYLRDGGHPDLPVRTDDVDYTLPKSLERSGRPLLVDLAKEAGFEVEMIADNEGLRLAQTVAGTPLDLDLITDGEDSRSPVEIDGQSGLLAQGYPFQNILLENAEWISVGPEIHAALDPPRRIRIPTVAAYVLHKGISATHRTQHRKKAKDLVYMFEIVRHPSLGAEAIDGLHALGTKYPDAYLIWRECLENVAAGTTIRADVAEQIMSASVTGLGDRRVVMQEITARFRRVLAETSH